MQVKMSKMELHPERESAGNFSCLTRSFIIVKVAVLASTHTYTHAGINSHSHTHTSFCHCWTRVRTGKWEKGGIWDASCCVWVRNQRRTTVLRSAQCWTHTLLSLFRLRMKPPLCRSSTRALRADLTTAEVLWRNTAPSVRRTQSGWPAVRGVVHPRAQV